MPKNKQKKSIRRHRPFYKTPLFVILIIILVALAGLFVAKKLDEKYKLPTSSEEKSEEKKEEKIQEKPEEKTEEKTEKSEETSSAPETSPDGKTPKKYDGDDANLEASLTGSISTARFSGEKLLIRVNIDQYLSSGTCSLVLLGGGKTLEKTANLVPEAATSTCEGFDIPSVELEGFDRPILIKINLVSGSKTGTIEGSVE